MFKHLVDNAEASDYYKEYTNSSNMIHTKKYDNRDTINTEHLSNEIEDLTTTLDLINIKSSNRLKNTYEKNKQL